ncbi:MAG: ABC transporter ATP-binding protein [Ruminiclostridium sp.]|nr:ABC transporter ATP-binding protein [Ruminiclostridium sp.]MDD4644131.1 ABC transporter ATP-binding protein [Bacilli bacterium]
MMLIEVKKLTKKYGSRLILNEMDLSIKEGEYIAIMGISGSGKSTLLNIIGLIENFDSGELTIDADTNILPNSFKANKIIREKINYLFQNFALIDDETVQYNLNLALKYVKGTYKEKLTMMSNCLERVGLNGFEKYRIYELSGGEQQRVAVARIMLKPCKIVLADEPTGSLDSKNRDIILKLLRELNNNGKTIILVTHDKDVVRQCDRILCLADGRLS